MYNIRMHFESVFWPTVRMEPLFFVLLQEKILLFEKGRENVKHRYVDM